MARVRGCLAAYGQVRDNLAQHAAGFPSEAHLQSVLKRGKTHVPFALDRDTVPDVSQIVGPGMDTEGSQWIIDVVDRPDPRPVDVNVWGGTADLAQALWTVREQRSADELAAFVSKIRVHAIGDQDDTGPWIRHHFPDLFYILDHSRDGDKMHSCYRGMFLGGDESLTSRAWIDEHVRHDHGPLGALYPPQTWTGPNPHGALKEGDTPSWFYFYLNGLNVPSQPGYGGWGGRYAPNGTFYQDAQDTVGEETSGRATVWRWRPAFQNEFQARMDWCVRAMARPTTSLWPWSTATAHASCFTSLMPTRRDDRTRRLWIKRSRWRRARPFAGGSIPKPEHTRARSPSLTTDEQASRWLFPKTLRERRSTSSWRSQTMAHRR